MLKTVLTAEWGLRYPIINASMTPAAVGALARAVSDAGGLGMIGVNETWSADDVRRECKVVRGDDTSRPFGIGFAGWGLEAKPELLAAAIAEKPFLINISFLDVAPYVSRVRAAGIKLAAQVQSRADAHRALDRGVDVLIAQGTEAGGHTGDVSTLTIMQVALAMTTTTPVVAAGGIATPAGVAAALAAGCAGVWVGTPFLLAREANVPDAARERIMSAAETDTVLTSLFDRVRSLPWPSRYRGRALQNDFTLRWHGRESEAAANPKVVSELGDATREGRYDIANIYAGQSAGLLTDVAPAAQIVTALGDGAEALLRARAADILAPDPPAKNAKGTSWIPSRPKPR